MTLSDLRDLVAAAIARGAPLDGPVIVATANTFCDGRPLVYDVACEWEDPLPETTARVGAEYRPVALCLAVSG